MVRAPFIDTNGIRRGAWSQEEDDLLRAYVQRYGHWNWRALPRFAGLSRCGKSCRLRWMNYLRPGVKHGNFSKQEEDLIIQLHNQLGNKWSIIAAKLAGRTDNEVKNYWHTNLKKKKKKKESSRGLEEKYSSRKRKQVMNDDRDEEEEEIIPSPLIILESSSVSSSNVSCDSANLKWTTEDSHSLTSSETFQHDSRESDFWTQPFVPEQDHAFRSFPLSPYFPTYQDIFDLFYQVMHDLPPN